MEYIRVTKENLEKEHICCAISNNRDVQVSSKKAWLAERFDEGLVFLKSTERGKCFIEYLPAEKAWNPVEAEGYMFIDCLWVSGSFKGHGYSNDLLGECIRDSLEKGKVGLCILSAAGKKPFVTMFFKDASLSEQEAETIQSTLGTFYTSLPSIGHEGMMGEPYSPDEMYSRWELSNAGSYRYYWSKRYLAVPIVKDILDRAEAVIAGRSSEIADLRFGHDSYLGPLNILLGLDGSLTVPADPDDFKYVYQNYNTCMAGNIQLVFYKSRKPGDEILVKALLCGREVTLPLPGDRHPYYRWSDFRKFYRDLCDQARKADTIQ